MNTYILDTNFFVNMEIKSGFGNTSKEVIENFVPIAKDLVQKKKASFYIPPRIQEEMNGFFENQPFYKELLSILIIKSPTIVDQTFNATVFYTLVEEMRDRSYKGLKIAEDIVEDTAKNAETYVLNDHIAFQKALQSPFKHLRDRYRQATRFNFLDSIADLDAIVLTKELDGILVSSDEGLIRWGRIFGIKEIVPHIFKEQLSSL